MQQAAPTPARERKTMRRRSDLVTRTVAEVLLTLDGLCIEDQLVVLIEATNDRLGKPHRQVYVMRE